MVFMNISKVYYFNIRFYDIFTRISMVYDTTINSEIIS